MPLQNRVLPTGQIIAHLARGTLTGNRGILHRADRTLGPARWRHKAWIACRLDWKGTRRVPMTPGTWTELFFLDEAVALAAGHRPCALCRRDRFRAFQAAWTDGGLGSSRAPLIDRLLHAHRTRRAPDGSTHAARARDLPDGSFVLQDGKAHLMTDGALWRYDPAGYGASEPVPDAVLPVLTPQPVLAVLHAGYRPDLHASLTKG